MKGLIKTLKNIWSIPELRSRILFTLILLAVYRLGSYIILPGINSEILEQLFSRSQGGGILGILNTFVGGSFSRGSIFALGIMPYISASIIIQLVGAVLPQIQKLQKEGESGQRKINQYTRFLAIFITLAQSSGYVVNLKSQYAEAIVETATFTLSTMAVLTAGTMFLVWLGERITEDGIGNGVSLIIMIGIISELPVALINESQSNAPMIFYIELLSLALVIMGVILITQATRKIPVNYARRMMGNRMMGGSMNNITRSSIPLKLNASGVMPIIFAQSLMFIPATIAQFFPESDFWTSTGAWFANFTSIPYSICFAVLIIVFTYFYTAIAVNPNDIAESLKRNGAFVPNVKPGRPTSEYIDEVLTRITLPGSIFLAMVALMPAIITSFGISTQFAHFFGGTSLLIMIGVVLDTLQQVESHLLMRHYDGLMKTGRIKGRGTPVTPIG
ncbi:MAG: preprotein translocase subunit SecY [Bacteroidia bacterium]|nr:preprotein translocase subunit SecY [Bacteroidia bacterium]